MVPVWRPRTGKHSVGQKGSKVVEQRTTYGYGDSRDACRFNSGRVEVISLVFNEGYLTAEVMMMITLVTTQHYSCTYYTGSNPTEIWCSEHSYKQCSEFRV